MLHMISAQCAACGLHLIAPGPLERMCWRQFAALRGDCKKSRIAPLNVIIIIIIIIIILIQGAATIRHKLQTKLPVWPSHSILTQDHPVLALTRARMHHKVVGNFGGEADVRSLYYSRFRFNETSDVGACTHSRPAK